MKRIMFVCMHLLLWLAGFNATAHDGTINVLGKIIENSCAVTADSKTLNVDLGSVTSKQFARAGDGSVFEPFAINLEKCPTAVKTITVHFEGTADSKNADLLALTTGASSAAGVGVGIYNADRSLIPFGDESTKFTPAEGETTVTLNFYARYVANGGTVTAGTANASATFVLTYA
ncbi:fimbrial protein [Enterobacter asburiae]|uniref:fimbrial protein n=1 Tax=Enterobacter asburiae TaxID=61645 RepID=UPI001D136336|nr:fimbrial protein [Enterobacter asburiae]